MYPIRRVQLAFITSFLLGIIAYEMALGLVLYLGLLGVAIGSFLWLAKKLSYPRMLAVILLFFLGSGYMAYFSNEATSADSLLEKELVITGEATNTLKGRTSVFVDIKTINGKSCQTMRVLLKKSYGDKATYLLGGEYKWQGVLKRPEPARNFGGFDEKSYLKSKGAHYVLKAKETGDLIKAPAGLNALVNQTRGIIEEVFLNNLGEKKASFLEAILFGEKGLLDNDFYALSQKMGLAHLFAVSGLHVGFLAMFLLIILKQSPIYRSKLVILLLGGLICYYILLVQGVHSAVRAGGLILITLFLKRFCQYRDLPTVLGYLLFLIALANPFYLFDIGLILSFCLALGIGQFFPLIRKKLTKLPRRLAEAFGLSISAELVSFPLTAYFFYMVTPFALIYNVILVPFFSILVPFSLASVACFLIAKPLGKLCFSMLSYFLDSMMWLFHTSLGVLGTGHFYIGQPSFVGLALYGAFLLGFYYCLSKEAFWQRHKKIFLIASFIMVILFIPHGDKSLKMMVLDVGQGSSATYQLKNGQWLVFDTGPSKDTLATHLRYMGANEIEAVILSHGDSDHVAGLSHLLRDFKVNHVFMTDYAYETSELIGEMKMTLQKTKLHFLHDAKTYRFSSGEVLHLVLIDKTNEPNSHEIVSFLESFEASYLLPGDTDLKALDEIPFNKQADIVLAPHHGSKNSYKDAFYLRYQPKLVIASSGKDNRFNHPNEEVISGLKRLQIPLLETRRGGGIYFYQKEGLSYKRAVPSD